jgi:hypothetical protein
MQIDVFFLHVCLILSIEAVAAAVFKFILECRCDVSILVVGQLHQLSG